MREFRIKVNNEKTYVVKANDYNQAVKTLHSKLRDNAVSDSISRYTGEDAIRTNGFVKIKEDSDWTSYKYNGSDFDNAVFKIHQYNPSLIAFVSNGNRTITVRNKYLKDSSITDTDMKTAEDIIKKYGGNPVGSVMGLQKTRFVGQDEIRNQHDFATDLDKAGYKFYLINGRYRISPKDSSIKDDLTMVEKYKKSIIYIDDNGYYYHTPIGGRGAKAQRDNTKDINIVKKRIDNYYSFLYDSSIKDTKFLVHAYNDGKLLEEKLVNTKVEAEQLAKEFIKKYGEYSTSIKLVYSDISDKLIDSDIKDSDSYQVWTINEKGVYHKEADVPNPQLAKAIASQLKKQGRWVQISKNSRTNIVSDCDMMDSLSIKVKLNGKTYKGIFNGISNTDKTFGDVYIPELVSLHSEDRGVFNEDEGRYVSDGKFYFKLDNLKRWNPSLNNYLTDSNITDADPVKVEKIIRKEKSALGITYYIFQTKSSSGYTIYYQVTDKTYHGEPTYSGGGIISLSLKSANDTLDHNLLADKLKAKYGEKEGTKRYLRGENDSAIKDSNIKDAGYDTEYAEHQRKLDAEVRRAKELHKVNGALDYTTLFTQVFNYKSRGDRLTQLTKTVGDYTYVIYLNNNRILYCVWDKSGNIPKGWCPTVTMYDEYTIKDSNNIKNRKSYTIKVGDKQYKVFAESESEAINKYIKSKKQ